jgi:acyl-CoA thioester hydrolase
MKNDFRSQVRVLYADTDAMGIVNNTHYFRWFEQGRNELLRAIGFPYSELEKQGIWLPLTDAHCTYKLPAVYDDVLEIIARVDSLTFVTVTIGYEVQRKATGETLVTGYTTHAVTNAKMQVQPLKKAHPELHAVVTALLDEQ